MKRMIRKTAEWLMRERVMLKRFPKEFGRRPIIVSPDSALKLAWSRRAFDPMLLEFARREVTKGMTVWDIGANVGIFSVAAAHRSDGGTVVAIEPDPFLASLLRRTTKLFGNSDLCLRILSVAIAGDPGATVLEIAARGRASNSIREASGSSQMGGIREEILVPVLRLDDLLGIAGPPNVVKVDVEGAEMLLLGGAREVLAKHRPVWLIEVTEENSFGVAEIFSSYDYVMYEVAETNLRVGKVETCTMNTFAIPKERDTSSSVELGS